MTADVDPISQLRTSYRRHFVFTSSSRSNNNNDNDNSMTAGGEGGGGGRRRRALHRRESSIDNVYIILDGLVDGGREGQGWAG